MIDPWRGAKTSNPRSGKRDYDERLSFAEVARSLWNPLMRMMVARFQKLYFRAVESVGHHKRDILVARVESARDSLEEAKDQFQSALEKFSALTRFNGGELEDLYRQLKIEFDYSTAKALAVRDRIDAVQDVGEALFAEWEAELEHYSSRTLKTSSRQKLRQTQQHYGQLITAMRRAEARIEPVLRVFQDQVLYLKHNLNAKAIISLEEELIGMTASVAGLIGAMERSIGRANEFVRTLNGPAQRALAVDP